MNFRHEGQVSNLKNKGVLELGVLNMRYLVPVPFQRRQPDFI